MFRSRFRVSVRRREVIRHMERHGFALIREGGNHSIFSNGSKTVPIARHRVLNRIVANEICKQAGLEPQF